MRKTLTVLLFTLCVIVLVASIVLGGAETVNAWLAALVVKQGRTTSPVEYSGFEVDVLVEGRPLEEYAARGRRYVEAIKGLEYAVRIRNPLPVRVAVALSVDGLNTIDARRTTRAEASKWVIEPYGTITVSGWQMSSERARRLYFTTEQDSYAAKLGRPSDLGLISAVFFREQQHVRPIPIMPPYRDDDSRVREEGKSKSEGAPSSARARGENPQSDRAAPPAEDGYAATGIGRSVRNDVRWVNLNLDPRPTAEVTVRYEYYDALVRLGVFPRPRPQQDGGLRRRERARGFEDSQFCPEP